MYDQGISNFKGKHSGGQRKELRVVAVTEKQPGAVKASVRLFYFKVGVVILSFNEKGFKVLLCCPNGCE